MIISILVSYGSCISLYSLSLFYQTFWIRLLDISSDYIITLFLAALFYNLFYYQRLFVCSQRSFSRGDIEYLMSNWTFWLALLIMNLLTIRTLWVYGAYNLIYFIMSIYLMKIPFHVFYISDIKYFLAKMWLLILLLKI